MARHLLTKSRFMAASPCPKRLWLDVNRKDLGRPPTDDDLHRMKVGAVVEKLARGLYPGAVSAWQYGDDSETAAETTRELIRSGAETILQATFIADGCLARIDALRRAPDGTWVVDEIKSSTVKMPKELRQIGKVHDLAFQMQVLGKAGLDVTSGHLVLLDGSYIWPGGDYNLDRLFGCVDMTEECAEIADEVRAIAAQTRQVLDSAACPEVETNTYCADCPYYDHCHRNQPKNDVVFLPGVSAEDVRALRQAGCVTIDQIPDDQKRLTPPRKRMRDAIVSGRPYVGDGLAEALETVEFPAVFIDFETCQDALPVYPGTHPYTQVCFQWSAHILASRHDKVVHLEYLHGDQSDPRAEFCRSLLEAVQGCRTIVHYTGFEKRCLREMAAERIPYAAELYSLLDEVSADYRGLDLEKIVREHLYLEAFKGRSSIKSVLPALVPGMTYEGMLVNNGNAAAAAFRKLIGREPYNGDLSTLRRALLDYCKQDTLAMVEIYWALLAFSTFPRGLAPELPSPG